MVFFFLMIRRPPGSKRTDTHFPYTTLFRALLQATQALLEDRLPVAQRQKLAPRPAMLDGLVNEVVAAFGSRLPRSVALETVSSIGLWPVFVDSEQIMRALDALVANAVEAVAGQGRVYAEALNVRAGRAMMQDLPGLKSGDNVCLRVTAKGSGMPPDLLPRHPLSSSTRSSPKCTNALRLTTSHNTTN